MTDMPAQEPDRDLSHWIIHESLFQLYDRILGETAVAEVLGQIGGVVADVFAAESSSIYLLRHDTWELEAHVSVYNVARTIRLPIRTTSLAGFCASENRGFIVPDAYGDLTSIDPGLKFDRSWDEAHGFRTRDVMCAPAVFKGEVVGVVQVLNSKREAFDETGLEALQSVARMVGYALYQARIYDDLATLKQLQKEKAKFMGIMVHEFKSPVGAARMLVELLHKEMVDPEQRGEFLGRVLARLDALQQLISDSLEFSKVESGDTIGVVEVFDLREQAEKVVEQYREPATVKGLDLKLELAAESVPVRFDNRGIQLTISNLVSNAVKYTEEGVVSVAVGVEEGFATVAVTDSGIGIPEEDIPKLFKEFFRASNARDSTIEGTGVGLAAIKSIVERFGGELRLKSQENIGSTFTVRIPLCRE